MTARKLSAKQQDMLDRAKRFLRVYVEKHETATARSLAKRGLGTYAPSTRMFAPRARPFPPEGSDFRTDDGPGPSLGLMRVSAAARAAMRDDDDDTACPLCTGTGEGVADGVPCSRCHGSGECRREPDDYDPPEPDDFDDIGERGRNLEFGGMDWP